MDQGSRRSLAIAALVAVLTACGGNASSIVAEQMREPSPPRVDAVTMPDAAVPEAPPPLAHVPLRVVEPVQHRVPMPDAGAPDTRVDAATPDAAPDAPDSSPPPPSCTKIGYDCGSSACCDGMSCVNVGFGLVCETPEDYFALAACTHIGCPGWATAQDTCLVSFRAAMQRLDPQDPGCLERAAKALVGASCSEAAAIADPVTAWKGACQK